ncbi:HesB/IscA family protein [Planktothrix agardhii]|uniref:HesB/IscA family protein n=1 Tax=Planktothrix agardhii TaxID=1160 RepID=UPI000486FF3D|nr:iron-sulfur cluster assembly accessory protein [Planktothrix agardhii]CAD0230113.1 conserved hypothetical protein [Planktothrix agardhii]CAD5956718.1 putative protein slr1565 [Planktothrix agardhii]
MISLSPAATREVLRLQSKQNNSHLSFRLGVQKGGCCDWSYTMGFDETQQSSDIVYQSDQIKIVVEPENLKYLENLTIDYSEDLMGGGFRFQNPNTTQSCSCGHSFVAKSQ